MLSLWQQCFCQESHMNYYTLLALLPVSAVSSYLNASVLELFFSTRGNFIIDFEQNYPSFPTQRVLWQNHHFCKIVLFFFNISYKLEFCISSWVSKGLDKQFFTETLNYHGWVKLVLNSHITCCKGMHFILLLHTQFELLHSSKGSLWKEEVSCIPCRCLCYQLIPHNKQ